MMAAPFLLILVISKEIDLFKWLLAFSFITDAADGYLARRYKVISIAGSKLDSIADDVTIVVAMIGIIGFKPEFLKHEIFLFILLFALFILQTVLALSRYGKISSFHTYGAKIAAILQAIFLVLFFFSGKPLYGLFYITIIVTAIELVEEIIITLWLRRWETNVKGLYWIIKRKGKLTT